MASARFTYGDTVTPSLSRMTQSSNDLEKISATFKYAVSGSKDSQPLTANNKLDVGTYTLYAYINGENKPVAEAEFTVVQRAVTLRCHPEGRRCTRISQAERQESAFSHGRHENMTADGLMLSTLAIPQSTPQAIR